MTVCAPYNFVPLSAWVYEPDWAPFVSHDAPFADGLCGEIAFNIIAETPILLGVRGYDETVTYLDRQGQQRPGSARSVHPFQIGGRYAIPPASFQGMLRNLIEIISFSRFRFVDDKRFGIRDLAGKQTYGRRLFATFGNSSPAKIKVKVKAGLLWFDHGASRWKITQCKYARVKFADLAAISGTEATDWEAKEDVPDRYGRWGSNSFIQQLSVHKAKFFPHARRKENGDPRPRHQWVDVEYSIATQVNPDESGPPARNGLIVLTGKPQPGAKPSHKKQEFFFYDFGKDDQALNIDDSVYNDFREIHEPGDGRDNNPNWEYWKTTRRKDPSLGAHEYIPVFYIVESGQVSSFGLAMMFKLAHELSTHNMIDACSKKHLGAKRDDGKRDNRSLDFATALFGDAAQEAKDGWGMKGRVSFDFAMGPKVNANLLARNETVLMGAKPSYYPTYVQQPEDPENPGCVPLNNNRPIDFASYTPVHQINLPTELASHKAAIAELLQHPQLNGYKRYPVHFNAAVPPAPKKATNQQRTIIYPLRASPAAPVIFTGKLRFHNLRPVELGALVWALTWGGDNALRHALGMGKPFGLGRLKINITGGDAIPNDVRKQHSTFTADDYDHLAQCFAGHMDERYKALSGNSDAWLASSQLKELLAMAKPDQQKDPVLRYMRLDPDLRINEFVDAKKEGAFLQKYSEI